MKTAGEGVLAAGLYFNLPHGAWLTASAEESQGLAPFNENKLQCDVLVVGGGLAAMFAAIKAKEQGADVILVDKGYAGRSGQSPFASGTIVFDPAKGQKLEEWTSTLFRFGEYITNHYWSETCLKNSLAIHQDMVSYGVTFTARQAGPGGAPTGAASGSGPSFEEATYGKGYMPYQLRQHAEKIGVKFVERVMIVELIKQNGRVVGAVGISPEKFELYTFAAQATILCTGACSYKPVGYPPIHQLTGDGEAAAYRAGAEILGKEFIDTHPTIRDSPNGTPNMSSDLKQGAAALAGAQNGPPSGQGAQGGPPTAGIQQSASKTGAPSGSPGMGTYKVDGEGNRLPARAVGASTYGMTYLQEEFIEHAGQGPIYGVESATRKNEIVGGACLGMSIRKADGVWPADNECRASVAGLFAAGDSLGTMQNGAVYSLNGGSTLGCAVTGAIAGTAAAKEAQKLGKVTLDDKEVARTKQFVTTPRDRKSGFSPRWVAQLLQYTMTPYFVYFIKKADRLQAAITQIEFMQEHLVPMMFARDPHELRLAHETRNMVLSAEFRLRSALFRTESRGNHYREDFPSRDDKNWLAWSKIKPVDGKMTMVKVPMPKEWLPDASIPYEKRYLVRFPGEKTS